MAILPLLQAAATYSREYTGAWGMMGANVFLGLRFAVWDDADGSMVADAMSRVWHQGFTA